MSLFPIESDKSVGFYKDFLQLVFGEMLWITGFFLFAWIIVVYVPLPRNIITVPDRLNRLAAYILCVVSFIASLFVSFRTLETFANSSDEYAYLYQAQTLAKGKLWEQGYQSGEFYYFNHIAEKDGVRVGRFPPGWPAVLSIAYVFHVSPALMNPVIGFTTLLLFFFFVRKFYDESTAIWSVAILSLSSFFIFNAASYFSHMSCALFSLSFIYCLYTYTEKKRPGFALAAGFFLGMIAITRYYTAVLMFLPVAVIFFYRFRWKCVSMFLLMGLGAVPCVLFLFWYNYVITGNPLTPVTMWAYTDEAIGFVKGHTVIKGIEHVIRWTALLEYWTSPAILILYVAALWQKVKSASDRWSRPEDYFYIVLVVGYFFYYQIGGNQYGPRFFFEAFPFVVVMVVDYVINYSRKWTIAFLIAGLCFGLVKFPVINAREHQVIEERRDLEHLVEARKISNAVIFVSSHTGVIRPMPIGDLTRNDLAASHSVIYVQDLGPRNKEFIRRHPGRKFYIYERNREHVNGSLTPIIY